MKRNEASRPCHGAEVSYPCHGVEAGHSRHCEERSDEAIQTSATALDCFAPLAMTVAMLLTLEQVTGENAFTAAWEPESSLDGITYDLFHNESGTALEASGLPSQSVGPASP